MTDQKRKIFVTICCILGLLGCGFGIFILTATKVTVSPSISEEYFSADPDPNSSVSSDSPSTDLLPSDPEPAQAELSAPVSKPDPSTSPAPAANGHTIAIDAGHQAHGNSDTEPLGPGSSEKKAKVSSGTVGKTTGIPEYELNLAIALQLKEALLSRGYEVVMIRETHDVDISNAERAETANESGAEIFLRIHANGNENTSVRGALTMAPSSENPYVGSIAESCRQLSQSVIDAYCASTGLKNLGVQFYDNMSGINWCKIPVTILEMGFMTNPEEDTAMQDPVFQQKMVTGIADGVDSYFHQNLS